MIIRRKHKNKFTIVPNAIYEDRAISIEAKGVLGYLLSRPHNWQVRHGQLQSQLGIGRRWLERILRELIDAGYLRRDPEQGRDELNRFSTFNYIVSDIPERNGAVLRPSPVARRRRVMAMEEADVHTAQRPTPMRGMSNGNKKEGSKTDSNNSLSKLSLLAPPCGGPQVERQQAVDRGRIEIEIAHRIGSEGIDVLSSLAEFEINDLCDRQRNGVLDEATIATLRLRGKRALYAIGGS